MRSNENSDRREHEHLSHGSRTAGLTAKDRPPQRSPSVEIVNQETKITISRSTTVKEKNYASMDWISQASVRPLLSWFLTMLNSKMFEESRNIESLTSAAFEQ